MSKKHKPARVPGTKVRPLPEHKRMCLIIGGNDDPVVSVGWETHRHHPRDSGYTLITSSAPDFPADATDDDLATYCLACTLKRHPEAEPGLKLARAYGAAYWSDESGEWIAEDDEGNEVVFDSGDKPIPGQLTVDDVLEAE